MSFPETAPALPAADPYSGALRELFITPTEVRTPVGTFRRATTTWTVGETIRGTDTPLWAIVTALVLIPCTGFLSLFFLLAKEPAGPYQTTLILRDGPAEYRTVVYTRDGFEYQQLLRVVSWARAAP